MKHAGKAALFFLIMMIVGLILFLSGAAGNELTILLLFAGMVGVGFLGLIISLICWFYVTPEQAAQLQAEKSKELARLARNYGVSIYEFCFNIGGRCDPIWIDTVHGLFAGVCVIDTIERTVLFPVSHILSCSLEEETETVSNAKSRAIVGGMLAGSVGAIAGASSATKSQHVIGYLLIVNTDLPKIGTVVFRVNQRLGVEAIQYLKG